jgi:lysophospholipase L1-like esterase
MAISSETSSATYAGNNSTVTAYTLAFPFSGASEIVVTHIESDGTRNTLAVTTGYTLQGDYAAGSGTLKTVAAIPVADSLLIERFTAVTQSLDSESPSGSYPTSIETQLDRTTRAVQDLKRVDSRNLARSLRVPDGELAAELPAAATRKGRVPYFNATTGAVETATPASILLLAGGAPDGVGLPPGGTPGQFLAALGSGTGEWDYPLYRPLTDADAIAFYEGTETSLPAAAALNRCLVILEEGGIRDELVDLLVTGAGYNTPSAPLTLKLATVTMEGSPDIGAHGFAFDGNVAQRVYFPVANTPIFSLAVDARSADGIAGNAVYVQLANSAGLATAGALIHLASTNGVIMTAQSGNYANSASMSGTGHGYFVSGYNNTDQIIVATNDNAALPTVNGYGNGVLLISDSTGNNVTTSALNRVTLGAFSTDSSTYENPFKGTIRSVALFNRVLTAAEVKTVTRALRQLDLRDTLVTYGDSQTAQLNIATATRYNDNWPLIYTRSYPADERVRLHNAAVDSMAADLAITSFDDLIAPFAPDYNGQRTATIILAFGTNDIDDGASAATILTRYQSLAAAARDLGFRVIACTVMHNTYFSGGQDTIRTDFNTLLRADTSSFDAIWDWSDIVGTAHDAGLWLDTLHLNGAGNLALAANLAAGGFPRVTAFT